jgi:hypothetical protein
MTRCEALSDRPFERRAIAVAALSLLAGCAPRYAGSYASRLHRGDEARACLELSAAGRADCLASMDPFEGEVVDATGSCEQLAQFRPRKLSVVNSGSAIELSGDNGQPEVRMTMDVLRRDGVGALFDRLAAGPYSRGCFLDVLEATNAALSDVERAPEESADGAGELRSAALRTIRGKAKKAEEAAESERQSRRKTRSEELSSAFRTIVDACEAGGALTSRECHLLPKSTSGEKAACHQRCRTAGVAGRLRLAAMDCADTWANESARCGLPGELTERESAQCQERCAESGARAHREALAASAEQCRKGTNDTGKGPTVCQLSAVGSGYAKSKLEAELQQCSATCAATRKAYVAELDRERAERARYEVEQRETERRQRQEEAREAARQRQEEAREAARRRQEEARERAEAARARARREAAERNWRWCEIHGAQSAADQDEAEIEEYVRRCLQ